MNLSSAPLRDPISDKDGNAGANWQRWFASLFQRILNISSQNDEIKLKLLSQKDEPKLSEDSCIAIWQDITDSQNVKTYLLYRSGSKNFKIELT